MEQQIPTWVEPLCQIARVWRNSTSSIHDLFAAAAPDLRAPDFDSVLKARLQSEPALVEAWQQYSYDKRGTPSPFLDQQAVGFAGDEGGRFKTSAVHQHSNRIEACADFIHREAMWVLERRQPESP